MFTGIRFLETGNRRSRARFLLRRFARGDNQTGFSCSFDACKPEISHYANASYRNDNALSAIRYRLVAFAVIPSERRSWPRRGISGLHFLFPDAS